MRGSGEGADKETNERTTDSAGVIVPPPFIFLGGIVAGKLLEHWISLEMPWQGFRLLFGWLLILCGAVTILLGIRELRRNHTTIDPMGSTTALATHGPYGWSRNPLYLSLSAIYLGIGLAIGNLWILLAFVPTVLVIQVAVIRREERYLEAKFGHDYRRYRSQVRRWL